MFPEEGNLPGAGGVGSGLRCRWQAVHGGRPSKARPVGFQLLQLVGGSKRRWLVRLGPAADFDAQRDPALLALALLLVGCALLADAAAQLNVLWLAVVQLREDGRLPGLA